MSGEPGSSEGGCRAIIFMRLQGQAAEPAGVTAQVVLVRRRVSVKQPECVSIGTHHRAEVSLQAKQQKDRETKEHSAPVVGITHTP